MAADRCSVADCVDVATGRCFDCSGVFCDGHRTIVRLPAGSGWFREELCETCLARYREALQAHHGASAVFRPALDVVLLDSDPATTLGEAPH